MLQIAWTLAQCINHMSTALGVGISRSWSSAATAVPSVSPRLFGHHSSVQCRILPPGSNVTQMSSVPGAQLQDKELQCKYCSNKFIWCIHQQQTHARLGYDNIPTRCPDCKPKQICHDFAATGECRFGDS